MNSHTAGPLQEHLMRRVLDLAPAMLAYWDRYLRCRWAFLATLAHELRNPLAPISNSLALMERANGDLDVLQRAQTTMERQIAQTVRLIDDLLDVSRITRDRLGLKTERTDASHTLSTGGLGIGLDLAKRLTEPHGGTIAVSSPGQNQGSEFVVQLPVLPAAHAGAAAPSPAGQALPVVPHRILVVDDNQDGAQSLSAVLELDGQDIVMIAMTGWGQADDRRKSSEAGFDSHCVKPVDHALLFKLITQPRVRPG